MPFLPVQKTKNRLYSGHSSRTSARSSCGLRAGAARLLSNKPVHFRREALCRAGACGCFLWLQIPGLPDHTPPKNAESNPALWRREFVVPIPPTGSHVAPNQKNDGYRRRQPRDMPVSIGGIALQANPFARVYRCNGRLLFQQNNWINGPQQPRALPSSGNPFRRTAAVYRAWNRTKKCC